MRFALRHPMTNDDGLVGNIPSRRWLLDTVSPSARRSALWRGGRDMSCDWAVDGVWAPGPDSPSDVAPSGARRHSVIPSPSPSKASNSSGSSTSNWADGRPFRPLDTAAILSDQTMTGSGNDSSLPATDSTRRNHGNGKMMKTDDVNAVSAEVVDRMSTATTEEDGVRFFLPVMNSPGVTPHPTHPPASNPFVVPWWPTVTPTGSDLDPGSRSQSISSHESSDLDCLGFRVRDDSGIAMIWSGEGVPKRTSSAPTLNDQGVCLPSPSRLIEFPSDLGTTTPTDGLCSREGQNDFAPAGVNRLRLDNATQHQDAYTKVARFLPSWDLERLTLVFHRLSICRFYLGKLSFDEAKFLLKGYPVGTFLLRDSSDSRFLFSLSVQTTRGSTSIRIVYEAGHFRLDCDVEQLHLMPTFDCVIRLLRHYIRLAANRSRRGARNNFVFLETTGRRDTPVLLRRPWANRPSPLKHLCRLRINGVLGNNSIDRLQLIPSLKDFLKDYPYDI